MKQTTLLTTVLVLSGSLLLAGAAPKDEVVQAAKKLAKAGNYTWKSTRQGGQRASAPMVGKITKDGLMMITMTRRDTTTSAVLKGEKGVVQTADGWQSLSDLEGTGDQPNRNRFLGRMLRNIKPAAVQAENLAKNTEDLTVTDGVCSGKLTEAGIKTLLSFGRRAGGQGPSISNGKGSVKFWVKNGILAKYQYQVQGTMTFNNNDREIDRTTLVEISDVGSTKVEVPAAAKAKMN